MMEMEMETEGISNILHLMGIIMVTTVHGDDDSKMVSNIIIVVIKGTTFKLATDSMLHSNHNNNHLVDLQVLCSSKEVANRTAVTNRGTITGIINSNRIWTK